MKLSALIKMQKIKWYAHIRPTKVFQETLFVRRVKGCDRTRWKDAGEEDIRRPVIRFVEDRML